tara:strand:- start:530 stop:697 length:168 start_codon:yes stop_codon:yes gene_type:complete
MTLKKQVKILTEKTEIIKEALLWYKRKVAIVNEDINIEEIADKDIEDVVILTEKK